MNLVEQLTLEKERRRRHRLKTEDLGRFIPRVTPRFEVPDHVRPIMNAIERASRGEEIRLLVAMPPQHGKTETTKHGLIYTAERSPSRKHAYCTYADKRAWRIGKATKTIAKNAGLEVGGTQDAWLLPMGGMVRWVGIGGQLTGDPIDGLAIVDDPYSNMAAGQSAAVREDVDDWFRSVLLTRCNPGSSIIVIHTRWHNDDLIGTLQREGGWESVNIPAINETDRNGDLVDPTRPDGAPLWPSHRPLDWLLQRKKDVGDFIWASLYQGRPRPRGANVFEDVRLIALDQLRNVEWVRYAIGVDLAYTRQKYSDYSVAVVLAEIPPILGEDGKKRRRFVVAEVLRKQERAPQFAAHLKALRTRYPGAPTFSFVAGTELGTVDFMNSLMSLGITAVPASTDKFQRALPVSAAWNDARIFVPDVSQLPAEEQPQWVDPFIAEVISFTGVGDSHDDQVDALAGAFAAFTMRGSSRDLSNLPRQ